MAGILFRGLLSNTGGGGGGGGGGFSNVDTTPPALGGGTGCRLYVTRGYGLYTDNPGTTLATAAGDTVAYWKDYSGSNNHLTQNTSGSRPVLSASAAAIFNGSSTVLNGAIGTFSGITDGEFFVLIKCAADPAVSGGGSWFISGNDNSSYPYFDGNIYEGAGTSGRYVHSSPGGLTTWHVYSVRTSGTNWQSLKNNVAIDTRTGNTVSWGTGGMAFGSTAPSVLHLNAEVSAIVMYDGARTSGERASIVAALLAQSPP